MSYTRMENGVHLTTFYNQYGVLQHNRIGSYIERKEKTNNFSYTSLFFLSFENFTSKSDKQVRQYFVANLMKTISYVIDISQWRLYITIVMCFGF